MIRPSNLLSPVLAILAACALPAAVMGADNPPVPKAKVAADAVAKRPLIVIHNPDGTFTIQKVPPNWNAKDATAQKGLIIPPQVVVPFVVLPEKKSRH